MSTTELRRVEVMERVRRGELKLAEAAELLELSYRQAKRPRKRYNAGGAKALAHRGRGCGLNWAGQLRGRAPIRPLLVGEPRLEIRVADEVQCWRVPAPLQSAGPRA